MKQSTMEAYAEVDSILNLMDSKYYINKKDILKLKLSISFIFYILCFTAS